MPNYDYKCKTCGKEFEYLQKINDKPLELCPPELCDNELKGAGKVQRIFSKNVSVVFKGNGFYQTDYVKKSTDKSKNTSE